MLPVKPDLKLGHRRGSSSATYDKGFQKGKGFIDAPAAFAHQNASSNCCVQLILMVFWNPLCLHTVSF